MSNLANLSTMEYFLWSTKGSTIVLIISSNEIFPVLEKSNKLKKLLRSFWGKLTPIDLKPFNKAFIDILLSSSDAFFNSYRNV